MDGDHIVSLDLAELKRELSHSIDQTLKAELAQLELRLVKSMTESMDRKADLQQVVDMDKRVQGLETNRAERAGIPRDVFDLQKRMTVLERFRYAVPSVAFVSMVLSMVLVYDYVLR